MTSSIEKAGTVKLTIRKGRDYSKKFIIKDSAGVVIDLSAYTFKAQAREDWAYGSDLIKEFTIDSSGKASGEVIIKLTNTETLAITQDTGVYDLVLTDGSSIDETYVEGTIDFREVPTALS
jgi:hypothetical protein